jgi:hypothetical protein
MNHEATQPIPSVEKIADFPITSPLKIVLAERFCF